MQIVFAEGAPVVRGVTATENFSLSIVENPTLVEATSVPFTDRDANFAEMSGEATPNNFIIDVCPSLAFAGTPVFESSTPETAAVTTAGAVSHVADGYAKILVHMPPPLGTQAVARTMKAASALGEGNYFQSYIAGTLGYHITQKLMTMVSGKAASDDTKKLFASNNYSLTAPAAVRNPDVFTGDLDLSAISIINGPTGGVGGYIHPGMLISPRHIIGATHFPPGSTVVFMRADGSFVTANVLSRQNHVGGERRFIGQPSEGKSDVQVAYLDREVTGITPFKFLPLNWRDYLPTAYCEVVSPLSSDYKTVQIPCLSKTAHTSAGGSADQISINEVTQISNIDLAVSVITKVGGLHTVLDTRRFYSRIIGGDSGGPVFVPINDDLALLTAYWQAGSGTSYSEITSEITSTMNLLAAAAGDTLAGTYAVSTVDLGGFTSYV